MSNHGAKAPLLYLKKKGVQNAFPSNVDSKQLCAIQNEILTNLDVISKVKGEFYLAT